MAMDENELLIYLADDHINPCRIVGYQQDVIIEVAVVAKNVCSSFWKVL